MSGALLAVDNLHVEVDGQAILKGLDIAVGAGEIHAVMGPNGAGKSTLANVLAGRPDYAVTAGSMTLKGVEMADRPPEERAHLGRFSGLSSTRSKFPGVNNMELPAEGRPECPVARHDGDPEIDAFRSGLREARQAKRWPSFVGLWIPDFLNRGVNEGFSGGEKKRNEILQMAATRASRLAILDETDSGLDIDALKVVAAGVNAFRSPNNAVLLVTHYQRLLNYVVPDRVHVLADGRIVRSGDQTLAEELERKGYGWLAS